MKRKVKKLVGLIAALIILAGCQTSNKEAQLEKLKKQQGELVAKIKKIESELAKSDSLSWTNAKKVAVTKTQFSPFDHFIEVQGQLDGDENVAVYPEGTGIVKKILVREGQQVRKGQVLAKLNTAAAEAQLESMQANLDLATSVYKKQKNLWDQKIGSEVQFLQAKTNKESLESQIAALKDQISMQEIKAPIDGTVENMLIKLGQIASPLSAAYYMVNFSKLKVVAEVSETYASKINNGDEVMVYLPDAGREVKGIINFSSRYINTVNRTFEVEVHLETTDPAFKANMIAVLRINDYHANEAISTSVNLVQNDQRGQYVFIAQDEGSGYRAKKVYVKTGLNYNGMVEITGGLKPGELLIDAGYQDLEDNQMIRI